jgi:hypothetical protein
MTGRPTIYTDKLATEILTRISMGESVRRISMDDKMPSQQCMYEWIFKDLNGFGEKYARAKEECMELKGEEIEDIADFVEPEAAKVAKARLQIDTKKWVMSKLAPKKYGEKQTIDQKNSGTVELIIKKEGDGL